MMTRNVEIFGWMIVCLIFVYVIFAIVERW